MPKQYLDDAVYVDFNGYALVLTTENNVSVTNVIVLELEVYEALTDYVTKLNLMPSDDEVKR